MLAVIPARYGSTRLPGKPLVEIAGRTLLQWVYEATVAAQVCDDVIVATDDQRIVDLVETFGGRVEMTSPRHRSGTDRVAEVASRHRDASVVVNIQGDQLGVTAEHIRAAAVAFSQDTTVRMSTIACPLDPERVSDPGVVKVVCASNGDALYFSRSPIPHGATAQSNVARHHLGIYGFRSDYLSEFTSTDPGPLELAEDLEQLRALENGTPIRVTHVASSVPEVNTAQDLEDARSLVDATRDQKDTV